MFDSISGYKVPVVISMIAETATGATVGAVSYLLATGAASIFEAEKSGFVRDPVTGAILAEQIEEHQFLPYLKEVTLISAALGLLIGRVIACTKHKLTARQITNLKDIQTNTKAEKQS